MSDKIKLFNMPRNSMVDVSEFGLVDSETDEKIECMEFLNVDGLAANFEFKGELVKLHSTLSARLMDEQPID